MVIVCQHTPRVVTEFSDIYVADYRDKNAVLARIVTATNEETDYILGYYPTLQRAKEVLYEIVNAYKEGLPVFEMPKE